MPSLSKISILLKNIQKLAIDTFFIVKDAGCTPVLRDGSTSSPAHLFAIRARRKRVSYPIFLFYSYPQRYSVSHVPMRKI